MTGGNTTELAEIVASGILAANIKRFEPLGYGFTGTQFLVAPEPVVRLVGRGREATIPGTVTELRANPGLLEQHLGISLLVHPFRPKVGRPA